jgi:hypothetical protein
MLLLPSCSLKASSRKLHRIKNRYGKHSNEVSVDDAKKELIEKADKQGADVWAHFREHQQ